MAKKNYQLHLKGYVGGWDFDSNYVDYVLSKNQDGPVSVLIDSTGGSLATALSIVAAFRQHGDVSVHYVGMNASAATIASLGAKHVSIDSSAMYLVHKCSSGFFQYGSFNADQLSTLIDKCEQMKSDLDKMDANVASMYARKCKKSPEDLLELMKKGGWLTAQEALDWGFVDEITDLEEDSAPVLTEAIAASMNMAGMPVPNLPYSMPSSDEQTIIQRFISALTSFFRDNGTNTDKNTTCPSEMTAGPSGETSATVHTHGENNGEQTADATPGKEFGQSQGDETQSNTMKNTYNLIAALLAVDAFLEKDGMVTLSAEQMQSIEDAIKSKDSIIASKDSELQTKADELKSKDDAIKNKDERITELTGQVEALKASPGSTTSQVHEESGSNGEKSDFEKYFESMQSARTLYDALP